MEEELENQEAEQPPATEENEAGEGSPEDEDEIEVIGSIILEEDGPTTRKIQTEFTVPCKGPEAAAMAAAAKGGPVMPPGPVYQPCGDMPLPPGADPWQWGFPEYCPRKMTRYAEAAAAAAAAAEAASPEDALPGEAADTPLDEGREEPAGDVEPVADEEADEDVNLSALSEDGAVVPLGEEVVELEKSSSEIFMDAIGMEEHEEWWSDEDIIGSSDALGGIKVDIEVEVPSLAIADAGSVGFQAPAAAEEDGRPQQEAAPEQRDQQPAEPQYEKQMDGTEATAPVLWKIEQEIAVVRSKLSEMQQKITALDIPDLSGGSKPVQRRKCVCDPQKKAAERGLPAAGIPPPSTNMIPETGDKYAFHSAPCLQQFNQRRSFTSVPYDFRQFPQQFPQTGGGVDIYIASRSGNTSAVTSISPANFQQYAEKPVLKAFTSPDVDVYVVTDNITAPGYSGQS